MPYNSQSKKRANQQAWRAANKAKKSQANRRAYLRAKAARLGVAVEDLPPLRQQKGWTRTDINPRKLHTDRSLDNVMSQWGQP